ncbi:hypothetical protein FRC08_006229, partial [Ceratobasidium sp. 394]
MCKVPAKSSSGQFLHRQSPDLNSAGPSQPTSPPSLGNPAPRLEYDASRQVYVERFPDPRAGAPINDEAVDPLDLGAYMAGIGNLGKPHHFDTADLLLTTGLTNEGRDAHLQSRL